MSDSKGPLVSVVVPTFNSARFLPQTVQALLDQTYPNLEVVITDDGSTDETLDLIDDFSTADSRINVAVHRRQLGPARTRNNSIDRARGRLVAFCDSDDVWEPEKLEKQVPFMLNLGAAISFTSYEIIDEEGRRTGKIVDRGRLESVSYRDMLLKRATMGCSTVMIDLCQVSDLAMPDMSTGQDYATWLSILRRGFRAHCLPQPLTQYRVRSGSISRNKFNKARRQWHIYRRSEKLGPAESAWCFANYAARAVFTNWGAGRPTRADSPSRGDRL